MSVLSFKKINFAYMYTITNVHLYPLPVNKKSGAFFPLFYTFSRS